MNAILTGLTGVTANLDDLIKIHSRQTPTTFCLVCTTEFCNMDSVYELTIVISFEHPLNIFEIDKLSQT